jgi:hypothetical protein
MHFVVQPETDGIVEEFGVWGPDVRSATSSTWREGFTRRGSPAEQRQTRLHHFDVKLERIEWHHLPVDESECNPLRLDELAQSSLEHLACEDQVRLAQLRVCTESVTKGGFDNVGKGVVGAGLHPGKEIVRGGVKTARLHQSHDTNWRRGGHSRSRSG